MERREKGEKREVLMAEKLKGGVVVGKRRGPSTPPPTWRLEFPSQRNDNNGNNRSSKNKNRVEEFLNFPSTTTLSARKLCAKLWQIQPHQHAPLPKMNHPRRHRRDTLLKVPNLKHLSQVSEV